MKKIVLILMFVSATANAQWVQMNNGIGNISVYSLALSGNNIFAGTNSGVYLSTNNGTTWSQTALNNRAVRSLEVNGSNICAGTYQYGVYLSTDNCTTWSQTSLNNLTVLSLAQNGNNIFAGTASNGVYLSTNNCTTWTQTSLNNQVVYSLAISGNNIFAGCGNSNGVYLSTNNGTSWTQTSLNNRTVLSLAQNGNNIFAGTHLLNGIYLSTNNALTWTQTSLNNHYVYSITVNGNNIFAGTYYSGVYVSNDNGASWTQRSDGLTGNRDVYTFCILNNYIFAGLAGSEAGSYGVFRRTLSELIGIHPISTETPNQFSLSQNYPNPFNPNTVIRFQVASSSSVRLVVYDALGREVETLVNEQLSAGTYEADWNADKFSSGVYYYKLTAGDFTETKKMVLMK